jgi:hypothetical protein
MYRIDLNAPFSLGIGPIIPELLVINLVAFYGDSKTPYFLN